MTSASIWFERKFDFTFPLELVPNILSRLRGAPARLEETLRGRNHGMLTRKRNGKWSAQEEAGHLPDMEPLWLSRIEDYIAGAPELTPADLTNRKTHEANHNSRAVEEILAEFRAARGKLLERVEVVGPDLFSRSIPHPRLRTPMRLADHLYFIAEHDDHHLARIWALLNAA